MMKHTRSSLWQYHLITGTVECMLCPPRSPSPTLKGHCFSDALESRSNSQWIRETKRQIKMHGGRGRRRCRAAAAGGMISIPPSLPP